MALPYGAEELEDSPRIEVEAEGATAVRVFRVPSWDDWPQFLGTLAGKFTAVGGSYQYTPPASFPGFSGLIVERVQVEPMDGRNPLSGATVFGDGTNRYPAAGAKVSAYYRTPESWAVGGHPHLPTPPAGTFLTMGIEFGVDQEFVPGRTWNWDVAGEPPLPDDVRPQVVRPTATFTLTWRRTPAPPWTAMRELRGKVNDAAFLGAAAETVLFLGARADREFHFVDEAPLWRVRYTFAESGKRLRDGTTPAGWNHLFRRTAGIGEENWTLVKAANSSGERPYQTGDFGSLFTFGS